MKILELKREAREALKNNWGYAVLVTVLVGVINFIPNLIKILLSGGYSNVMNQSVSAQLIGGILTLFLAPLSIGTSWYFLSLSRGHREKWQRVFDPFDISIYLKMLGVSLLVALYTILWSLLLIIPGIIKGIAYSQTMFILKDEPELTVNQAITKSRELMNGNKWRYFVFALSFIGWALLCIVTLGIGLLWLQPYMSTSMACFYNDLISEQTGDQEDGVDLENPTY